MVMRMVRQNLTNLAREAQVTGDLRYVEQYRDPWGGAAHVIRTKDMLVLRVAGPDGELQTDDDVIVTVEAK